MPSWKKRQQAFPRAHLTAFMAGFLSFVSPPAANAFWRRSRNTFSNFSDIGMKTSLNVTLTGSRRTEFGQNPERRFRMEKGNQLSTRPFNWHFVDQPNPGFGSLTQLRLDIIRGKRHMVDALAVLLQELGHRAVVSGRLQQLDMRFPD